MNLAPYLAFLRDLRFFGLALIIRFFIFGFGRYVFFFFAVTRRLLAGPAPIPLVALLIAPITPTVATGAIRLE